MFKVQYEVEQDVADEHGIECTGFLHACPEEEFDAMDEYDQELSNATEFETDDFEYALKYVEEMQESYPQYTYRVIFNGVLH